MGRKENANNFGVSVNEIRQMFYETKVRYWAHRTRNP